jgi:hypothetical protein
LLVQFPPWDEYRGTNSGRNPRRDVAEKAIELFDAPRSAHDGSRLGSRLRSRPNEGTGRRGQRAGTEARTRR